MFTTSMAEEVKQLEEEIEAVKDKIDDPVMCEKVRQYIYAPKEIQAIYKADAGACCPNKSRSLIQAFVDSGGTSQSPCCDSTFGQRSYPQPFSIIPCC